MSLDVYVGPLTRYHLGDWETIAQQSARSCGEEVRVLREGMNGSVKHDPQHVRQMVLSWRDKISGALGDKLAQPLSWDEDVAAPYYTDKPAWECYSDLILCAAYEEQPQLQRPTQTVERWMADAAVQACNAKGFKSRYSQLIKGVELWLPAEFDFTFRAKDAVGNVMNLGSSIALLKQLRALNDNTWKANEAQREEWLNEGTDEGAPLEEGAKFALAVFLSLSELSVRHCLPMILDY